MDFLESVESGVRSRPDNIVADGCASFLLGEVGLPFGVFVERERVFFVEGGVCDQLLTVASVALFALFDNLVPAGGVEWQIVQEYSPDHTAQPFQLQRQPRKHQF